MPRRWNTNTRYWAYKFLVLRDGEQCQDCGLIPTTRNTLDIDHIDRDKHNNEESNLRLLCRACNVARENKKRTRAAKRPSVQVCERENPSTRVRKEALPYSQGSPEMQASFLFELDFRKWILKYLEDNDWISRKEAVNAGAEAVGCSITTSRKYLEKLTSMLGPLTETKNMLGDIVIIPKFE